MSSKSKSNLSGKSLSSLVQSMIDKKVKRPPQKNGPRQVNSEVRQLLNNRVFNRTFLRSKAGSNNSFCLEGREVLSEVYTTSSFTGVVDQPINPANPLLFPRLSTIAQAFEQYHFVKLRFTFVTGTAATTVGSVLHYIDYDVTDAAAPSALQLLANESATISSVALDSSVSYDINNQMLEKLYTNNAIGVLAVSELGAERQDYCGRYRMFTDKGASPVNVFAGYVYVDYEIELFTPISPEPLSECAINDGIFTVTPGGSITPAFNDIKSADGITPNSSGDADPATYSGANCGGVIGALDAAKTIYQAGEYLYSLYAGFSAAAVEQRSATYNRRTPVKIFSTQRQKTKVHDDLKEDWADDYKSSVSRATTAGRPNYGLSAGDVSIGVQIFDVTNGVIDSDFPASAVGMAYVTAAASTLVGLGAVETGASMKVTVPLGKRYMCRPVIALGPTTGRTITAPIMTVSAVESQ